MSKGTTIYRVRLPDDLVTAMNQRMHWRNMHSPEEPLDMSEFIRLAVEEKIAHMDRGADRTPFRKKVKERIKPTSPAVAGALVDQKGADE